MAAMTGGFLRGIDEVIARGPFAASWRSLEAYSIPAWYRDAKLGIFLHWGLYATALEWPQSGRWLVRTMAQGHNHAPAAIREVALLGTGPVRWSRTTEGLLLEAPPVRPAGAAFVLKVT